MQTVVREPGPIEVEPASEPAAPPPAAAPSSRRSLLAAGISGLAGLLLGALGRPLGVEATAGQPLVLGSTTNSAGTADTALTTASAGTALLVTQTGAGTALRGSATAVDGIAGFFTSANGPGVSGVSANKDKYAVYAGQNASAKGAGAALRANGQQNDGIVASTANATAYALRGVTTATVDGATAIIGIATGLTGETYGVVGESDSAGAYATGVVGWTPAASGATTGVLGQADSATDYTTGVVGFASATSGQTIGVYGESDAATDNAMGIWGHANGSSGITAGVFGSTASPDGYAVYAGNDAAVAGALFVTGNLSKGGGSFKIDHPLDPANKFLYHSFVESPDMKNVYDGVVTLDGSGEAIVELPSWFDALNRDVRYQLTAIGESAPDLHVSSEVKANRFAIAGGKAGQKVSWQVTGIRQDAWANAHRIPMEEPKPKAERGLYLHPSEHGQPKAKGIDHARTAHLRKPMTKVK